MFLGEKPSLVGTVGAPVGTATLLASAEENLAGFKTISARLTVPSAGTEVISTNADLTYAGTRMAPAEAAILVAPEGRWNAVTSGVGASPTNPVEACGTGALPVFLLCTASPGAEARHSMSITGGSTMHIAFTAAARVIRRAARLVANFLHPSGARRLVAPLLTGSAYPPGLALPVAGSLRPACVNRTDRPKPRSPRRMCSAAIATLGLSILAPATAQAQLTVWNQRIVDGPSIRSGHAMAYDSARGVTVLFGGASSGETWEWNGAGAGAWAQRMVTGPSPRNEHAMAYDSGRGVTVLFGGNTGTLNGETWEWDGTSWTLRSTGGPVPRSVHAMAYDSARHITVLFGGYTGAYNGETWEWDGTAWAPRNVGGPAPSRRGHHAMVYDAARGVTVIFGGFTEGFPNGETWEWNGTSWTLRSTAGVSPRYRHAMAYDAARGVTVLFGGENGVVERGDSHEWNGAAWTQRLISGPSVRRSHAMSYDAIRGVTVLFGGYGGNSNRDDTWELCASEITAQPFAQSICPNGTAGLAVTAAGTGPFTYRWRKDTVPIDTIANPSAATATLTLTNVQPSDAGFYDCVVTNACGSVTSNPATLTVCPADFNCDGFLDFFDIDAFVTAFEAGDTGADFNGDGFLDFFDADSFVEAFEAGC